MKTTLYYVALAALTLLAMFVMAVITTFVFDGGFLQPFLTAGAGLAVIAGRKHLRKAIVG
jgi:hypothetical protein